jgi:hypothetical protein
MDIYSVEEGGQVRPIEVRLTREERLQINAFATARLVALGNRGGNRHDDYAFQSTYGWLRKALDYQESIQRGDKRGDTNAMRLRGEHLDRVVEALKTMPTLSQRVAGRPWPATFTQPTQHILTAEQADQRLQSGSAHYFENNGVTYA